MNFKTLSSRLLALCLMVAVLHTPATFAFGTVAEKRKLTAELTVFGLARVDGEPAISGQTLFSGSTIETAQEATSIINLGARGRLGLLRNSSLRLSFDESSFLCSLDVGSTRVSAPTGVSVNVMTTAGMVIADPTQPAVFSVDFFDGELMVAVLKGNVELRAGGRRQQVKSGEFASVDDDQQPQSNGKKFSRRKLAAILLSIGGALAVVAFVFANGDDSTRLPEGGCVEILSPTTGGGCP